LETFTVTGDEYGIRIVSGDGQIVGENVVFNQNLKVELYNKSNNDSYPRAGIPVTFTITSGDAIMQYGSNTETKTTDSNGQAQVMIVSGTTPETITFKAAFWYEETNQINGCQPDEEDCANDYEGENEIYLYQSVPVNQ